MITISIDNAIVINIWVVNINLVCILIFKISMIIISIDNAIVINLWVVNINLVNI